MKIGDKIRVMKGPAGLRDDDDLRTRTLFDLCLGRTLPIAGIDANRIELHVGQVLGVAAYIHSIYIEPEYVEVIETSN